MTSIESKCVNWFNRSKHSGKPDRPTRLAGPPRVPFDPLLVGLPIGLWVFSFFCDILCGMGWGGRTCQHVALYTLLAGLVVGVGTTVGWFADYHYLVDRRLRRMARSYLLFHAIAMVLYLFNFGARLCNARHTSLPTLLSFFGVVFAVVSGGIIAGLVHEYRRGLYRAARQERSAS